MKKAYKNNKYILIPELVVAYLVIIGGYIWVISSIKNSYFPIIMSTIYGLIGFILITISIPKIFKEAIVIDNNKVKIITKDSIGREIELSKIICIEYYYLPLVKCLEFIKIYEENKIPNIIPSSVKNYLEIYKYIVENSKDNANVIINQKLLKRVENVKYK